jgi:hypothetical protein
MYFKIISHNTKWGTEIVYSLYYEDNLIFKEVKIDDRLYDYIQQKVRDNDVVDIISTSNRETHWTGQQLKADAVRVLDFTIRYREQCKKYACQG